MELNLHEIIGRLTTENIQLRTIIAQLQKGTEDLTKRIKGLETPKEVKK